ncbi:RNA-binding S4 domain-containing protein, partial [Flavobacteriaceae bacterium]|nr:RNA-binding S4 domain-containing protein [Flavobacteriaceae bacterium]
YSKDYYRTKGTGRPTKKDRRDINDYHESQE